MGYLIAQIFLCLLVAALLGGLIGWLLRGLRHTDTSGSGPSDEDLRAARTRIASLERDLAECRRDSAGGLSVGLGSAAAGLTAGVGGLATAAGGAARSATDTASNAAHSAAGTVSDATSGATATAAGALGGMGLFGTPAPAAVDDLAAISGIGPIIETQLAGIGVTTFRQIARFTPADIARVNEALGVFKGRIEREDWVAQAARLHRDAYGTDV